LTKLFFQYSKITVIVCVVFILLARFIGTGRESSGDLLAYTNVIYGLQKRLLILYDVNNRMKVPVFNWGDSNFDFSLTSDGQLAYSSFQNDHREIYLLDTRAVNPKAVNITQTPDIDEAPLAGSLDGRYLAYVSNQDNKSLLYVWDGTTAVNITPKDLPETALFYTLSWGKAERLAITVHFGNSPTEIYLWDGITTSNLSQNSVGADNWPVWSMDGRLAFFSERTGNYHIYVWDGVSFKDGSPDSTTYADVASQLINYTSYPNWTKTGLLSFIALSPQDNNKQIYVWDGHKTTSLNQDLALEGSIAHWSSRGQWSLTSSGQLLLRDADNQLLFRLPTSQYVSAWSPNGFLMFCTYGWTLSVWDGQTIIKVTEGNVIYAKWENGNGVVCSSG
jgi:Tol biopolymer transport system component